VEANARRMLMERLQRGFRLAKSSFEVLRADTGLLLLPLLAFVTIAVLAGVYFAALWGAGLTQHMSAVEVIPLYFIASFVSIFSTAAVVATADLYLQGRKPTLGDGVHVAATHVAKLALWAVVTTTVGLIIRLMEERAGIVGRIVLSLIGMAWGVATFMVVPVLLFEDLNMTDSVKRSAGLFRQKWGEQLVGNGSIGLAMMLIGLVALVPVGLLFALSPVLGIVTAVALFGALAAVSSALTGIFNAALYRYATTGVVGGPFSADDLQGSFRSRGRGNASGPQGSVTGW
jgi:hypothetical protein